MTVLDPGHTYSLDSLDGETDNILTFVKRDGDGYPGNVGSHPGTNIQEVLRVLIDRLLYLDSQEQSAYNVRASLSLRAAFRELEMRAAERHKREWIDPPCPIDQAAHCGRCGHIGCTNHPFAISTEARDKEAAEIHAEWFKHRETHEYLMRCDVCEVYMRRIVLVLEREVD